MTELSRRSLLVAAAAMLTAGPAAVAHEHAASAATSEAPLPTKSIYQLAVPLTDQSGRAFPLAGQRGTPVVLSMFYTSCQFLSLIHI